MPWLFFICLFWVCPGLYADSEEPRILFLGDDSTFHGSWVVEVESAIRTQKDYTRVSIVNMALPGETVSGLSESGYAGGAFVRPNLHSRLTRILNQYKPTLVIANYGMNDGIFLPLDEKRFKAYQEGIIKLRNECIKSGAKIILLTPSLYAADKFPQVEDYEKFCRFIRLGWSINVNWVGR
jgi:hypothetical protein